MKGLVLIAAGGAEGSVTVRAMRAGDVPGVAGIHRDCLPHGLFPRLGSPFMREYYRSFLRSPHAIALVWEARGGPGGFVVGTMGNRAHYRWVLRNHSWKLAVLALLGLLQRPWLAATVARRRLGPYAAAVARMARDRGSAPAAAGGEGPVAVLTHVAVASVWQGNGMGRLLHDHFLRAAVARGAAVARLSTQSGSGGATAFYLQRGWRQVTQARDWDGRDITVLSRDLTDDDTCAGP